MTSKRIIPCGGLALPGAVEAGAEVLPLNIQSTLRERNNVILRIADLSERLYKPVPDLFVDLLEIATYVNCADQATSRGEKDVDTFGASWRRHFEFHIPVRVPEFWNSQKVKSSLTSTLEFLADDKFDFNFQPMEDRDSLKYFQTSILDEQKGEPEGVVLFSGGLDSLAGAVEEAVEQKRRIMLVNHRPTKKLNNVHRKLEKLLALKAGDFRPAHLHVQICKRKELNREYTQRTRSFLYVALGATVAKMLGHRSVRFYENGVVSMNLPVCAQVVGTRATRTTHPRTLKGFQELLSQIAGEPFIVDNPFIWQTKGDVVGKILRAGCGELIDHSVSCAHTWLITKEHTHCGTCSQCIDRRFGVVAAKADLFDAAAHYASDVFTGARSKEEDRMMVATYLERANQVRNLRDVTDLIAQYPEVVRVFGYLPGNPLAVAQRALDLHRRHAAEVTGVVDQMLGQNVKAMREHTLAKDCLLRMVFESGSRDAAPVVHSAKFRDSQEARLKKKAEGPDTYRLSKGHKVWRLTFQGKEEVLGDDRGVALVDFLLQNPPEEPIHATELEARVDGNPATDDFAVLEAGLSVSGASRSGDIAVIQEASGAKLMGPQGAILKAKLSELRHIRDDQTLPESERESAKGEILELLRANGKGGKMADAAGRSAERVRKAIKRLIDEMKVAELKRGVPNKVLRGFAEHLDRYLWLPSVGAKRRTGATGRPGCFTYDPPLGVSWKE